MTETAAFVFLCHFTNGQAFLRKGVMKKKGSLGLYFMCVCVSSGSRRASDDPEQFEFDAAEEQIDKLAEEQKEYLRWYYRTEDCKCYCDKDNSCKWKYKMLKITVITPDWSKCCTLLMLRPPFDWKKFKVSLLPQFVQPQIDLWLNSLIEQNMDT